MTGYAHRKLDKLAEAKRIYLSALEGVSDIRMAKMLGVSPETAHRYRKELGCTEVSPHRFTLEPTPEDIELAQAILWRAEIKKDAL